MKFKFNPRWLALLSPFIAPYASLLVIKIHHFYTLTYQNIFADIWDFVPGRAGIGVSVAMMMVISLMISFGFIFKWFD